MLLQLSHVTHLRLRDGQTCSPLPTRNLLRTSGAMAASQILFQKGLALVPAETQKLRGEKVQVDTSLVNYGVKSLVKKPDFIPSRPTVHIKSFT